MTQPAKSERLKAFEVNEATDDEVRARRSLLKKVYGELTENALQANLQIRFGQLNDDVEKIFREWLDCGLYDAFMEDVQRDIDECYFELDRREKRDG